ncbi:hypothetical protein A8M77_32975 [Variovorax sp. JS1663]|nr:hypothetical protein A8M77_32975 [Variovorax sp. JS1663]
MTDTWQWEPFSRWLQYVTKGAISGVVAGALFTTYAWLTQTPSSLPRKILATALVIGLCVAMIVFRASILDRCSQTS